eukprot:TRINITY_DN412_c0_g1_i1.p1 TRINITY_DN412_c0_g1~~TRINITY_DN412_c0_g1_i1.p1  ORF type:complete len:642 (+),score=189.60 TRINITY_DN412_c0_g1_i1:28-1926(+)
MSDNQKNLPKWDFESFNLFFGIYRIPRIEGDASLMLPLYEFPKLPKALYNEPNVKEIYPTAPQHQIIDVFIKMVLFFYNKFFSMIDEQEHSKESLSNEEDMPSRAIFSNFQVIYTVTQFEHYRNGKKDVSEDVITLLILQPTIPRHNAVTCFNRFFHTFNFLTGGLEQMYRYARKTPEFVYKYLNSPQFPKIRQLMRLSMTRILLEKLVIGMSVVHPLFFPYLEWCLPVLIESENFILNIKKQFPQFLGGILYFENYVLYFNMGNELLGLCDSLYKMPQNESVNNTKVFVNEEFLQKKLNIKNQAPQYASIFDSFQREYDIIPNKPDDRTVEELIQNCDFHGTWVDYQVIKQDKISFVMLLVDEQSEDKIHFDQIVRSGMKNLDRLLEEAVIITKKQLGIDLFEKLLNNNSVELIDQLRQSPSFITEFLVHNSSQAIISNVFTVKNQHMLLNELFRQFSMETLDAGVDELSRFNEKSVAKVLEELGLDKQLLLPHETDFMQRMDGNTDTADRITFLQKGEPINKGNKLSTKDILTDLSKFSNFDEPFHSPSISINENVEKSPSQNRDFYRRSLTQIISGNNRSIMVSKFGPALECHVQYQNASSNLLTSEDIRSLETNVNNHLLKNHSINLV